MQGGEPSRNCVEHNKESIQGFCRDCMAGICFRCAIGSCKGHTIQNIDEMDEQTFNDLTDSFDKLIVKLIDKAEGILEKAQNQEKRSHSDKIPLIQDKFFEIRRQFEK